MAAYVTAWVISKRAGGIVKDMKSKKEDRI